LPVEAEAAGALARTPAVAQRPTAARAALRLSDESMEILSDLRMNLLDLRRQFANDS
jgi:hypothetical protein